MLKGLIFDLDGVITDTAEYHYLAWTELAKELGIEIDRDFNENLKGVSRIESLNLILSYGNQKTNYSDKEKSNLAHQKNEHYKTFIEKVTPEDLLPGIKKLLHESKELGLKMAIASASKNAPAILDKLEVTHYFDAIVNPADLNNGKPDPEIFNRATEMLKLEKNEVVGIEDAYSGIQSINRAGIFSIGVGNKETLAEADINISTTNELTLEFIMTNFDCASSKEKGEIR